MLAETVPLNCPLCDRRHTGFVPGKEADTMRYECGHRYRDVAHLAPDAVRRAARQEKRLEPAYSDAAPWVVFWVAALAGLVLWFYGLPVWLAWGGLFTLLMLALITARLTTIANTLTQR